VRAFRRNNDGPGLPTHQRPDDQRVARGLSQPAVALAVIRQSKRRNSRRTLLDGAQPAAERNGTKPNAGLFGQSQRPTAGVGRRDLGAAQRQGICAAEVIGRRKKMHFEFKLSSDESVSLAAPDRNNHALGLGSKNESV